MSVAPSMMKFVLENEVARNQCNECFGFWFMFENGDTMGYFRLSPVEPEGCSICEVFDKEVEAGSLLTLEGWVNADE